MNKSRKQLTIEAVEKMIDLYDNPKPGHRYFNAVHCSMCIDACDYCILRKKENNIGCGSYPSMENAIKVYRKYNKDVTHPEVIEAFKKRADFYRKVLKIIKSAPAKKFTKSEFSEFTEIKLEW